MSEEDQQSKPSMHEMKSMLQETKKEILNEVQVILQETKDEFDGLDEPKEEGNWCIPGKGKYVGARNEVAAMEQFRRFTKPGTIWSAAKGGTVQQFESAVKKGQDVYKFGEHYHETVLHVACLFSNTPVALHIARNYPKLIPQQYGWIYKGETALHIAVVNGDVELAKGLLDVLGRQDDKNFDPNDFTPTPRQINLLHIPVTGTFFDRKKGNVYFGDHPLSFAICSQLSNKKEMIRLLIRYGARLDIQDKHGNTLLHICVEKGLIDMYGYVLDLVGLYEDKILQHRLSEYESDKKSNKSKLEGISQDVINTFRKKEIKSENNNSKENESKLEEKKKKFNLELLVNNKHRTPLNYAAVLGKTKMLQEILNKRRKLLWRYGPVVSYAYPLEEIDSFKISYRTPSTALMLITYSANGGDDEDKSLLQVTPFWDVLQEKWKLFARTIFIAMFIYYVVFLFTLTLSVIRPKSLMTDENNAGPVIFGCQAYVLACVCLTIFNETVDLLTLRTRYFSDEGSRLFYLISWSYSILILCSILPRLVGYIYEYEDLVLAAGSVLAWIYVLYFTRGESHIGYYVVILRRMILTDLSQFIVIYAIFLLGFSLGFFAVYRDSGEIAFIDYPWSMLTLFHATLFDFDNLNVRNSNSTGFTLLLFLVYTVLTGILMLNMLIAMMNDTYSQVRKDSKRQWELEWSSIILFVERRLPNILKKYSSWFRVGKPGTELGIDDKKYYFVVNEKCTWESEKKKNTLRALFRYVIQGVVASIRMKNLAKSQQKQKSPEVQSRSQSHLQQLKDQKPLPPPSTEVFSKPKLTSKKSIDTIKNERFEPILENSMDIINSDERFKFIGEQEEEPSQENEM